MIIRASDAAHGFCVSEQNGTSFYNDPAPNISGVMQYCGAVNQMGVHVHWITAGTSPTHYYARDLREFDQNIEENTLMTDECDVGNAKSGVGTSSPIVLTNKMLTLYCDPLSGTYPGSGNIVFDNGSTLNIGSASPAQMNADFVIVGEYKINSGIPSTSTWTLNFAAGNTWDYYGYTGTGDASIGGIGHFILTGGSASTTLTPVGRYVSSITNPVIVNIHPSCELIVGSTWDTGPNNGTYIPEDMVATSAIFNFMYGSPISPDVGGRSWAGLALNDNATFKTCEFLANDNDNTRDWLNGIYLGGHGTWDPVNGTGTFDGNFNASPYSTAANTTVTFNECYFQASQVNGTTSGLSEIALSAGTSGDPSNWEYAPSALTVSGGLFDGWTIQGYGDVAWPTSISDAAFKNIPWENAINLNGVGNVWYTSGTVLEEYSILIHHNDFQTYLSPKTNTDGIYIAGAPDDYPPSLGLSDALREAITVTNNIFESAGSETAGSIESAIHFSEATGDIGYNQITADITSGSKYERGIWSESSQFYGTPVDTWSLIYSNTISGLTATNAAGISTDYYTGYAKLNLSEHNSIGQLSGEYDEGHTFASTYIYNYGPGYEGISNSQTDMTGVHHPSDPSADVAAFNQIFYNNSGGTQMSLMGTATIYLGLEPSPVSWPNTSPYGLNTIMGTLDISSANSLPLGDISNNYWGGSNYSLGTGITATGGYLASNPGVSGFECSDGLVIHKKTVLPLSSSSDTSCGYLFSLGYGLVGEGPSSEPAGYDTLRLFLEQCPFYGDTDSGNGPDASWRAFNDINAAISEWTTGGRGRWPDFLSFLKKVLYYNPDTNWYCGDVGDMITAAQSDAASMAITQYVLENHRCPNMDFATLYNSASRGRHLMWLDSIRWRYQNDGFFMDDSINADTLAHPYDSTIPSLYALDLQILMGPQYAGAQPSTPTTSRALLSAALLNNPMQNEIAVSFEMGREALVTMELRDVLGRSIPLTYAKYQLTQPGNHKAYIPAPNLPPGTYYLRISTDAGDVITLKVLKE